MKKALLFFSFLLLFFSARSQTTQGTDFWLTSLINLVRSDSFFVIVSAEKATTVKVEIPLQSFSQTVNLGYNDLQRVYIPKSVLPQFQDSVEKCGIHVSSQLPISVYAISAANYSTDASCVFPSDVQPKGGTYYVLNPIVYQNGYNSRNTIGIVCIDDSCVVDIIPATTTVKGMTAGNLYKKKLYKGQTYLIGALNKVGLEGTYLKAQAGKRIAVYTGDECMAVRCAACDHVFEVVPPTTTLGKKFMLTPFYLQDKGYDYQIAAVEDNTVIQENGNIVATLNKGKTFYRKVYGDTSLCVTADKPIVVMQYMTGITCQSPRGGDPSMLLINPLEQTIPKAIVSTANTNIIKTHFISLLVPKTGIDSVYLDGVLLSRSKFKTLSCGDYYIYSDSIKKGNHRIECRFGFISYLFGIGWAESYAYSAGSGLRNLQRYIVAESYPSCDSGFIVKLTSRGDSVVAFRWLFNNTNKDTVKNPFFYVSTPGIYPVKLLYKGFGKTTWDSTFNDVLVEKPAYTDFITFKEKTVCDTSYKLELPNTPIFSYLWNTGETTASLVAKKTGTYSVKIHNKITGCDIADTAHIQFYNKVQIKMAYKMAMFCPGIPLYLYDSSKVTNDTVTNYFWYADKSLRSTQKNDTIKSPKANEYEIKLVLHTAKGCKDSTETKIFISDIPTAVMGVVKYDTCFGRNSFRFNNGSYSNLGKIVRYKWLFGDGDTAKGQQVFKSYKDSGTFWARLIAFSEKGCFDTSDARKVVVYPTPKSAIGIADSSVCLSGNYFDFRSLTTASAKPKNFEWNWGDGTGSTFEHPGKISYADTGTYEVYLVASYQSTGCGDTVRRFVRVNESPVASMRIDSSDFCLNRNYYQFKNTSNAKGSASPSIVWAWGDGTYTKDTFSYKKKFPSAGTFKVKMYFSTGKGCLDSVQKNVVVYNAPKAQFSITDSNTCGTGNYFNLLNQSTAPANAKWEWKFGDGGNSTAKNPGKISYAGFGNFTIRLSVKDPLTTCTDTFRRNITVVKSPILKPRVSDSVGCTKSAIFTFTDSTDYGNMNARSFWMFNNDLNDSISGKIISKKFSEKGLQKATLVGGIPGFCADTTYLFVNIRYSDSPASVSTLIHNSCLPGRVDLLSDTKEGNSWTYYWDAGNGKLYNTKNVLGISYPTAGKHAILFTQTDDIGCAFSVNDTVIMFDRPTAAITLTENDSQCLDQNAFHFSAATSVTKPLNYAWTLDESNISTSEDPSVIHYTTTGKKGIKLIVTNSDNCSDTIQTEVLILPQPTVQIFSDSGCEGETRIFTASVSPNDLNIQWYKNSAPAFSGNPWKTLLSPVGIYNLEARGQTSFGCSATSNQATLTVFSKPIAKFGVQRLTPSVLGLPVVFIDSSIGANSWTWYPEPNATGTGIPYSYVYSNTGKARAFLVVENANNCRDTTSVAFELFSDEYGWFPGSFTPNGNGTNEVFKPGGLSAVKTYKMIIYNRWGEKVFETENPEIGWDGTYMGAEVPDGVYAYAVNMIFLTGNRHVVHGEVTLLR